MIGTCSEMVGTLDCPANLTQEEGQLICVTVDRQDISIAHWSPDTKSKKDRFIVKFVRRENGEKFYKSRKHLGGKKLSELPSVAPTSVYYSRTDTNNLLAGRDNDSFFSLSLWY